MRSIVSICALLLLLGLAGWGAVELARGDSPMNTAYLANRALQIEYDGQNPEPLLRRIAELNPTSSAPLIRLGLAAELRGDSQGAEWLLNDAYAVDRQFETRWTLANFYFRQGRASEFWHWIRSALEMSYGDRRPAFELCWLMSTAGEEILTKAIPDREPVLADYLRFAIDRKHMESVGHAGLRLAHLNPKSEMLPRAMDVLLNAARWDDATAVWRGMGRDAPSGGSDPDMQNSSGHGFDWREIPVAGVTHMDLDAPAGHRVRLSGNQPETAELLQRFVGGLRPGERYRLTWEAAADGLPGLEWRIGGQAAGLGARSMEFRATATVEVLRFVYARPRGEVRAEGSVDLRHVSVATF